jgi:hypothetical protein
LASTAAEGTCAATAPAVARTIVIAANLMRFIFPIVSTQIRKYGLKIPLAFSPFLC